MLLEVLEAVWMYQGLGQKEQKTGLLIYREIAVPALENFRDGKAPYAAHCASLLSSQ